MSKKPDEPKQDVARPVIAVEYGGELYHTFQSAEAARAKADLLPIICPVDEDVYSDHTGMKHMYRHGRMLALSAVLENAERIHGILSRYLDAAKVSLPTEVR